MAQINKTKKPGKRASSKGVRKASRTVKLFLGPEAVCDEIEKQFNKIEDYEELTIKLFSIKCPGCGSLVDSESEVHCPVCGVDIEDEEKGWLNPSFFESCLIIERRWKQMVTNGILESYIKLYEEIKERVQDEQLAATILREVAKDRRMAEIAEAKSNGSGDMSATPKQIGYLKKLGVEIEPGLTKARASELIDEARAKGA